MIYKISLFDNVKDASPKSVEVAWEGILKELSTHEVRDTKDGLCWSPTFFLGSRSNAHAVEVSLAVFDLDDCSDETLAGLGERLSTFTYALHSTYSPGCYRLVIPLSTPVAGAKWFETWTAIKQHLQIPADEACSDASRLYYFPACPQGGAQIVCENKALPFYVEREGLEAAPSVPSSSAPAPETLADNNTPKIFDLHLVRRQLKAVRKHESAAVVKTILNGGPLDSPPGRDVTMNRAASILATACTPPLTWEVALEILRPSLTATPQERVGHFDHWVAEMADMFARALQRRAKADAKSAELNEAMQKALGKRAASEGAVGESEAWRSSLITTMDKEGVETIRSVSTNANLVLENDPLWRGKVRFNEVTKQIDLLGAPIHHASMKDPDVAAKNWLALSHYRLTLRSHEVGEELRDVARRNPYDPLADWLEGLTWDGENRLESFFIRYFGAEGEQRYLERVGACWLIACVARALDPGCKVDNVLMLQGAQSIGKSRALKVLGHDFFSDTKFDIHDKDGRLMASRFWIIELGELVAMRKADTESLKAFFSASSDHIRAPYARVAEDFQRRCIFVGTTNSLEFLAADDQQRRYWPVMAGTIDLVGLAANRNQIFAEAVSRFKAGENWWLSKDDAALVEIVAQSTSTESPYKETVLTWWMRLREKPDIVTAHLVAVDALGMLGSQVTQKVKRDIGMLLRTLGFRPKVKRIGPSVVNAWVTPKEFLEATKASTGQILSIAKGVER